MNKIRPYLRKLGNARVVVCGDLILDHYIWGKVDRVSPEAPVPVVRVTKENFLAGGSANVALNIRAIDGRVGVCGVVGKDSYGKQLLTFLEKHGIAADGVILDGDRPTTLKTRIIGNHQHVVRVDKEEVIELEGAVLSKVKKFIDAAVGDYNVVILSDYAKGFVNKAVTDHLRAKVKGKKIFLLADPKTRNLALYKGFDLMTPNRKEATEASGFAELRTEQELIAAGRKIMKDISLKNLLITRGDEGMSLFTSGKHIRIPTFAQEVFDVTGAGDTVISVVAAGLSAGIGLLQSCIIANIAASIVVAKVGTATAAVDEIEKKWSEMDPEIRRALEAYL